MAKKENHFSEKLLLDLCENEGWEISKQKEGYQIEAEGRVFPLKHPAIIHLKLYLHAEHELLRYEHMKAAHDLLWPDEIKNWNYWTERRFREHCAGWPIIVYAGGANIGKSYDAAKIADLFWLAAPRERGVLVMSTTLESLKARIYGYCLEFLSKMVVPLKWRSYRGSNPKVLHPQAATESCAIAGVAAKRGDDETAIANLIGRHPPEGLMVMADEGTDQPISILGAIPNWKAKNKCFQLTAIGNSNDIHDLHGSLATPINGWASVDPHKDTKWETAQGGICLYFSPYESPAIHEPDPAKQMRLSKFLITAPEIEKAKQDLGEDSEKFWRFVLGFWKSEATSNLVISKPFLDVFNVQTRTEWSGLVPLKIAAGLDAAFSAGGDSCLLRLGIVGHGTDGRVVLDFRDRRLMFYIEIDRTSKEAAEIQIARQVIKILNEYNVGIGDLVVDATGQGRALGSVIQLLARTLEAPVKMYSVYKGVKPKESFDVIVKSSLELWDTLRTYIMKESIRGLDDEAMFQLTNRQIIEREGKRILEPKPQYKMRMGAINPAFAHSPDEADAAVLCLFSAILRYGFSAGQTIAMTGGTSNMAMKNAMVGIGQQNTQPQRVQVPQPACSMSLENAVAYRRPFM